MEYKAKRKDNGKWVEGDTIIDCVSGQTFVNKHSNSVNKRKNLHFWSFEVDLDTICKNTGLSDKNDKEIWENDIVEEKHQGFITMRYRVVWSLEKNSWMLETKSGARYGIGSINQRNFEVIGNIFDNPGLLIEVKI